MSVVVMPRYFVDVSVATSTTRLANMLLGDGDRVVLFLNESGVAMADGRAAKPILREKSLERLNEEFASFVKAGGAVVVCPHCAKLSGLKPGSVANGAKIGSEMEIKEMLAAADRVYRHQPKER